MKRMNFPHRREQRRKEAEARQEARESRAPQHQLQLIRERRGESRKERERLEKEARS